jgi:hypothetical protein
MFIYLYLYKRYVVEICVYICICMYVCSLKYLSWSVREVIINCMIYNKRLLLRVLPVLGTTMGSD